MHPIRIANAVPDTTYTDGRAERRSEILLNIMLVRFLIYVVARRNPARYSGTLYITTEQNFTACQKNRL